MKLIPPIESESHTPFVKGFWTDAELLTSSGAGSLAVVKSMQAQGLITPSKYKNENNKQARAWALADVLLVRSVLTLSYQTGFSLAAAVTIAAGIGRKWLAKATLADAISQKSHAAWGELTDVEKVDLLSSSTNAYLEPEIPESRNILIRDRVYIYHEYDKHDEKFVGRLRDHNGKKPYLDTDEDENIEVAEKSFALISCLLLSEGSWEASPFSVSTPLQWIAEPTRG